jgi:hypothetical protein
LAVPAGQAVGSAARAALPNVNLLPAGATLPTPIGAPTDADLAALRAEVVKAEHAGAAIDALRPWVTVAVAAYAFHLALDRYERRQAQRAAAEAEERRREAEARQREDRRPRRRRR